MTKLCLHIIFLLISFSGVAQTIELDRQLVGSGYTEFANDELLLSASVGEAVVTTVSTTNLIISQGFQQSNYVLADPLVVLLSASKADCIGANNGFVAIDFISDRITRPRTYAWSNGATDSVNTQLEVGQYSLTVTGANGKSVTNTITVGATDSVDCAPVFYSGFSPNGDGVNDAWIVDNGEYFTTRNVQIFNRYGALVWETDNYDNGENAFVGEHRNGEELLTTTYFYIARFDDSVYRGWIEITAR